MALKQIIIVDDLDENLFLVSKILKSNFPEYKLLLIDNAAEAFEACIANKPDLVITDWDMPKTSGIQLITLLKNNPSTNNIPIIIATGVMTSSEHLREALEKGAIDYIRKPFDEIELFARTKAALQLTEYYHKSIENKNYELSIRAINSIQNKNFVATITQKLNELKPLTNSTEAFSIIDSILESLEMQKQKNSWKHFDKSFRNTHNDYLKRLMQQHPTISNSELKLCNLIYLGMSCKKIAETLNQTDQSIRVSRSRLRKKLQLNSKQNIELDLKQI